MAGLPRTWDQSDIDLHGWEHVLALAQHDTSCAVCKPLHCGEAAGTYRCQQRASNLRQSVVPAVSYQPVLPSTAACSALCRSIALCSGMRPVLLKGTTVHLPSLLSQCLHTSEYRPVPLSLFTPFGCAPLHTSHILLITTVFCTTHPSCHHIYLATQPPTAGGGPNQAGGGRWAAHADATVLHHPPA